MSEELKDDQSEELKDDKPQESKDDKSQESKDDRLFAMLCHLLGIFTCWLGPLILWVIKRDQSELVADQGKEALNFQIIVCIGYVVLLAIPFLGWAAWPFWYLGGMVLAIIASVKSYEGNKHRYPFNLRLIK